MDSTTLPIYDVIPKLKMTFQNEKCALLQAPPGAGKSTVTPLELLNEEWLQGKKIIMLQPRRLATKSVAYRMAETLNEKLGETVGYRVRMENKVGPKTRIEVVTEAILTRMIQDDPELSEVGLLLFDEFHERTIQADLSLALALDIQEGLRDNLRILIMSATLDSKNIQESMNIPLISCKGRQFPVETIYIKPWDRENTKQMVVRSVKKALAEQEGSILVFLPGAGEILSVEEKLKEEIALQSTTICPLYGNLSLSEQEKAISPAPEGIRKIVLSTDIAETSITIEGITCVIDSGLVRSPKFNPGSGLTTLKTEKVSLSSAEQRKGRAGRLGPGVAYRLWSKENHSSLLQSRKPEIIRSDLSMLLLELSLWGVNEVDELFWLDTPPTQAILEAHALLQSLGALTSDKKITTTGRKMVEIGLHPRLAKIVLTAKELKQCMLGCDIAAILSERSALSPKGDYGESDLLSEFTLLLQWRNKESLHIPGFYVNKQQLKRISAISEQIQRKIATQKKEWDIEFVQAIVAQAYSDRIGQMKDETTYLLSNGNRVTLDEHDSLKGSEFLIVLDAGGLSKKAKIFRAVSITKEYLLESCEELLKEEELLFWDAMSQSVKSIKRESLGAITLAEQPIALPSDRITETILKGIRESGIEVLPWNKESIRLCNRIRFLHAHSEDEWPSFSDEYLLETLENWLAPFLLGMHKLSQLQKVDLTSALLSIFDWDSQQKLESLAPEGIKVPEGSVIAIDYSIYKQPVLAVKLQMMFGSTVTPTLLNGKVPLQIHLLSPAGRSLQITQDLISFWENSYEMVKKEMKGRYPKHPWPDNPMEAVATRKTKRQLDNKKTTK